MEKPKRLYCISDLHIGGEKILNKFETKKEFKLFLNSLIKESKNYSIELIIAGDFLNFWEIQSYQGLTKLDYLINSHKDIFQKIKQASKHLKITVIPGNHDHELACFKKYPELLKKWGINLNQNQNIIRRINNKKIWIEHGNQFDYSNKITNWGSLNDTPYGYHVQRDIILKAVNYAQKHPSSNPWLADLPFFNYPYKIGPSWFISNYFYKELAPILRYLITPFLFLFIFTLGLSILALLSFFNIIKIPNIFYLTEYLGPIKFLANFIIIYNFILLAIFLTFYIAWKIIKRDLFKSLKSYGIEINNDQNKKRHLWHDRAKKSFKTKDDVDIFIFGHSHSSFLEKIDNKAIINTGSWTKTFIPFKSWSLFPNVYIPYFELSYSIITAKKDNKVKIELKYWPKKSVFRLTFLQKISTLFKKIRTKNPNNINIEL